MAFRCWCTRAHDRFHSGRGGTFRFKPCVLRRLARSTPYDLACKHDSASRFSFCLHAGFSRMNAAAMAEVSAALPWFFPTVAFIFGACIGSFLNVVIYRLPAGKSIVRPGSQCACGTPIAWHDNIPIVSWFVLRGHARCCGRAYSFRYPMVELLTGLLFLACWLFFPPAKAACGMIFLSALIASTFIDLDHLIIPDVFSIGGTVVGVLLSMLIPTLHGQQS